MTPKDLKRIEGLLNQQETRIERKLSKKIDESDVKLEKSLTQKIDESAALLEKNLTQQIDESAAYIISSVETHKADQVELEKLKIRVTKLEQVISS